MPHGRLVMVMVIFSALVRSHQSTLLVATRLGVAPTNQVMRPAVATEWVGAGRRIVGQTADLPPPVVPTFIHSHLVISSM